MGVFETKINFFEVTIGSKLAVECESNNINFLKCLFHLNC